MAKLTRSRVSGPEENLNFPIVVIHSSAFVEHKDWLSTGWELLLKGAPYDRDNLLPAPFKKYRERTSIPDGFRDSDTAHVTCLVQVIEDIQFVYRALLYAAQRSQSELQGIKKMQPMQAAVARTFMNPEPDPLGEANEKDSLGEFLKTWDVPEKEVLRSKKVLTTRTFSDVERTDPSATPKIDIELVAGEIHVDDELDEELAMKKKAGSTEAAIVELRAVGVAGYGPQADASGDPLGAGAWVLYFEFREEGDQSITPFGPVLYVARI